MCGGVMINKKDLAAFFLKSEGPGMHDLLMAIEGMLG